MKQEATCRFGARVGHNPLAFSKDHYGFWVEPGLQGREEVQGTSTEAPGRSPTSETLPVEPSAVAQGPNSDMAISVFRRARHGGTYGPERA